MNRAGLDHLTDPDTDHAAAGAARRLAGAALRAWATLSVVLALLVPFPAGAANFDHGYAAWDALLRRHVSWNEAGVASSVSYRGFGAERAALKQVLDDFSAVARADYDAWSSPQRLAFLVNAYNAFTVELILTRYPDLKSIKDLGSLFQSPWKRSFFSLLGAERTLDFIEHEMIRAPGAFDDPRIHFVLVCASVGCPALRPEAIRPERLDAQFDDSLRRFLADRSRNRYDPRSGRLEVSRIFDWYRGDFEKGHRGIASREALFARYADVLADDPKDRQAVREARVAIGFLDYDWSLNDRR
jgi:hypothetical protein